MRFSLVFVYGKLTTTLEYTGHAVGRRSVCFTIEPYDWKLGDAETLIPGVNTIVIAGVGFCKILPWALLGYRFHLLREGLAVVDNSTIRTVPLTPRAHIVDTHTPVAVNAQVEEGCDEAFTVKQSSGTS